MPSVGRSGLVVASGMLVSRGLGFVNAMLLYNTIGTVGQGADAFVLANTLPNSIYLIIAGGTLSAVIVPAIVRSVRDEDGGQRFLNRLVTLGISLFLVVAVAITVAAPLIVQLYAQSGDRGFSPVQLELATAFAYWCLPQLFFYAVIAIFSEIMNAKGRFWPYAWTPVVNNLVLAAVLLSFRTAFGEVADRPAAAWTPGMTAWLAGGATLGIVIQATALVIAFRQAGMRWRPDFQWRHSGLGRFGRLAAWTFGATLVAWAGGIVESNVLSLATGEASIATMTLSQAIYVLPYSLVTISIAVPFFTRMSQHAQAGDRGALGADLTQAITTVVTLQVFAAAGMAVLAPWLSAMFTSDPDARSKLAAVLAVTLIGLVPASVAGVILRGWYAIEDTRTPFLLQLIQVVLYVGALIVIASTHVPAEAIAPGAALALAGAIWVNALLTVALIKRRVPALRVGRIVLRWLWCVAAMVPAALTGHLIGTWLASATDWAAPWTTSWPGALLSAAILGLVMAALYLAVLWATRNPELRRLLLPVAARLRRRPE